MAQVQRIAHIYRKIRGYDELVADIMEYGAVMSQEHQSQTTMESLRATVDFISTVNSPDASNSSEEDKRDLTGNHGNPCNTRETDGSSSDNSSSRRTSFDSELKIVCRRIRSCCNDKGAEMKKNLYETGQHFQALGELYVTMAMSEVCSTTDQKLHFIRAAVLFNAAIVRFGIADSSCDQVTATEKLQCLFKQIYGIIGSSETDQTLIEFCKELKHELGNIRRHEREILNRVKRLRCSGASKLDSNGKGQVTFIRELTEENSTNYRRIMVKVLGKCIDIMGDPPCDFAIVGLGSLARGEVTLSSDFEHAIILDDKVLIAKEIREYFRWITVLSCIIVIGLRETIVTSVDIKYLCDPDALDKSECWFKDEYTPCGLSLDGMMSHACKCPIGKVRLTKNRKHKVELIQTARDMATYMTISEQLKNGYVLDDILGTTCFIYGNMTVYDAFRAQCHKINLSQTGAVLYKQQRDLLRHVILLESSEGNIHVKKAIYRPISVLLHIIANIFKLYSSGSFFILDDLLRKGVIDIETYAELSRAVGVALEIRMRCSQTRHCRKNVIKCKDLKDLIGDKHAAYLQEATRLLISTVNDLLHRKFILEEKRDALHFTYRTCDIWYKVNYACEIALRINDESLIFDVLEKIAELLEQYRTNKIDSTTAYRCLTMQISALFICLSNWLLSTVNSPSVPDSMSVGVMRDPLDWCCDVLSKFEPCVSILLCRVGSLYSHQRYYEANKYLDECITMSLTKQKVPDSDLDSIAEWEVAVKMKSLSSREAQKYFSAAFSKSRNSTNFVQAMHHIGKLEAEMLCETKKSEDIPSLMRTIMNKIQLNSGIFQPSQVQKLLTHIARIMLSIQGGTSVANPKQQPIISRDTKKPTTPSKIHVKITGRQSHTAEHYKYSFGIQRNIGKHSNFTFTKSRYAGPLIVQEVIVNYYHAWQIFSAESYDDMVMLIEYSMNESLTCPKLRPLECTRSMIKHTKCIALLALCENIRASDHSLFEKLCDSAPIEIKKTVLFQSFIYPCLKQLSSRSLIKRTMVTKQNEVCKGIFCNSSFLVGNSFRAAVLDFVNFRFNESIALVWRILHRGDCTGRNLQTKFFLMCLLAIMIERKRECPLPHLRKCREFAAKHAYLWDTQGNIDKGKLFRENQIVSRFYYRQNNALAVVYNLAVDASFFDWRGSAALSWKLLHTGKVRNALLDRCSLLLLHVAEGAYGEAIKYQLMLNSQLNIDA